MLTTWFPRGPYNFDSVAPDLPVQPLRAIFTAVESALLECDAVIANLQQQITVQTATGVWLRNHAVFFGITPNDNESDDSLRARVLAAINTPRITCPALEAYLQTWFNANYQAPPTVVVCDLQTNPTLAAQYGLKSCQFLVLLEWQLGIDDSWFLNFEYLDYTTTLGLSIVFTPPSSLAGPFLTRWKGAGFQPIWFSQITYGYPEGEVLLTDSSSIIVDE